MGFDCLTIYDFILIVIFIVSPSTLKFVFYNNQAPEICVLLQLCHMHGKSKTMEFPDITSRNPVQSEYWPFKHLQDDCRHTRHQNKRSQRSHLGNDQRWIIPGIHRSDQPDLRWVPKEPWQTINSATTIIGSWRRIFTLWRRKNVPSKTFKDHKSDWKTQTSTFKKLG